MSQPLALSAFTLVSALGQGLQATLDALVAERSGLRPCDLPGIDFDTWIGRIDGLDQQPLTGELSRYDCRNNRLAWLSLNQDGFGDALMAARSHYGSDRIAVILGTSTSGIANTEAAYAARDSQGALPDDYINRYRYTHNTFSLADFVCTYFSLNGPAVVISTACSSSAKVFASASRFIRSGLCDAAVVGGVDTLCQTTMHGFHALQLTSNQACRPCDIARNGLSLGEAGAFVLIEPETNERPDKVYLRGYGESNDGHHMSHPHPQGAGASAAIAAAIRNAHLDASDIDYVHLHGTATRVNDQAEDLAVTSMLGTSVPCSSTKGWTGHTLGAAGATAAVICALAIRHGFIPGTLNSKAIDPALSGNILLHNQPAALRNVLLNIFGFGGNNCCLILGAGDA